MNRLPDGERMNPPAAARGELVSRRGFLRALGRGIGFAALGALLLRIGLRPRGGARGVRGSARCRRCPVLARCSAPQALAARDANAAGREAPAPDARPLCAKGPPSVRPTRRG